MILIIILDLICYKELSLKEMKFEEIKSALIDKKVGIAGAGGLGSNCAAALVRCGLGKLVIADFDHIEESNLNRQFYFRDQLGKIKIEALRENLLRINPDLIYEGHYLKLNSEKGL